MTGDYLSKNHPAYLFVTTTKTLGELDIILEPAEGYFRLFPFVNGSHTIDVVSSASQAFEAAKQFGLFTKLLSGFPAAQLHITLPDFHNLPLRYRQFETAINQGNKERIKKAASIIHFLQKNRSIVTNSESISHNPAFKKE